MVGKILSPVTNRVSSIAGNMGKIIADAYDGSHPPVANPDYNPIT